MMIKQENARQQSTRRHRRPTTFEGGIFFDLRALASIDPFRLRGELS